MEKKTAPDQDSSTTSSTKPKTKKRAMRVRRRRQSQTTAPAAEPKQAEKVEEKVAETAGTTGKPKTSPKKPAAKKAEQPSAEATPKKEEAKRTPRKFSPAKSKAKTDSGAKQESKPAAKDGKTDEPAKPARVGKTKNVGRKGFGADQTADDRRRALAKARVSTRNAAIVRSFLEEVFAEAWRAYLAGETDNHPNAVALYGLVGFPWVENEDGTFSGDFDFYRSSAARHYGAPSVEWFADPDDTIQLRRLVSDEGDETELIDVPLTDAVREYGLGYKANGTVKRGGLTVRWLLELQPNVSKVKSEAMLRKAGLEDRLDILLRSLHSVQYSRLLVVCGAESLRDGSEEDTVDSGLDAVEQTADEEESDDSEAIDQLGADLDRAAEDFRD